MIETAYRTDWPTLKGNNLRNSQSLLRGRMKAPTIRTKQHFGYHQGYVKLTFEEHASASSLEIPADISGDLQAVELLHQFHGLLYQVGDSRFLRHEQANYRLLHLYNENEWNLVYVTESLELHNAINSLVVRRIPENWDGTAESAPLLWEVMLPYYHERPHLLLADMNGDSKKELIVEGWEGVTVYDLDSHMPIMDFPQSMLHDSRKRGYVIAQDVTGNGYPDIVILSCYPWDVNLIVNDGKTLTKGWFKIYDNHIESAQIITRYTRLPLADYDGDGRIEMVFNIWNEQGDGQWHFKMLDAATGEERLDLPSAYLQDAADVDGDGRLELFLSTPSGIDVPNFSKLRLHHLQQGTIKELENSAWVTWCDSIWDEALALHPSQNPRPGLHQLVTGTVSGKTVFFTLTDQGEQTLLKRHTITGMEERFSMHFPRGNQVEAVKLLPDGGLLLEWRSREAVPGDISLKGGRLEALCWGIPGNQKLALPILADFQKEHRGILMANGVGQVACYTWNGESVALRWLTDGYGAAEQYDSKTDYGVVAEDFLGNGKKQVAVRVNGKQGGGMKLVDEEGRFLWQTEFDWIPSGEPCASKGILGFYTSAKAGNHHLLVVSGQRNVQHTGITYGLDGKTGARLWELDLVQESEWHPSGAGSFYLTACDLDGDGIDEVMTGYGNNVWAANGETGTLLFENFMRGFWVNRWIKDYKSGWVSSISPIPLHREEGAATLFFGNAGDSHGAAQLNLSDSSLPLTKRCTLLWGNEVRDYTDRSQQCVLTLWDGRRVIAEPAFLEGKPVIHLLIPETGEEIGTPYVLQGNAPAVLLSCDLDGCGKQELAYTAGNLLGAVRFDEAGWQEIFTMPFSHRLSWPIYGDADGDGFGELLVTDTTGTLYIIA